MKINIDTKFEIGEEVYTAWFGGLVKLEVVGIKVEISKFSDNIDIYYQFQPYNSTETACISEKDVFKIDEVDHIEE